MLVNNRIPGKAREYTKRLNRGRIDSNCRVVIGCIIRYRFGVGRTESEQGGTQRTRFPVYADTLNVIGSPGEMRDSRAMDRKEPKFVLDNVTTKRGRWIFIR